VATRAARTPDPGEDDLALRAVAGEVWRAMAEFTWSRMQGGRAMHALKSLGLTPGHLKVLGVLEPGEAIPMGTIAEQLAIDPSMATWLIDRLEERKLVERKMLATDRRVKVVSLTRRGERVKTKVFAELFEPPAELVALGRDRLRALRAALAVLPRSERPFAGGVRHQRGRGPRPHRVVGEYE
jgi:DNA-binding MarR family transcriptional regulator